MFRTAKNVFSKTVFFLFIFSASFSYGEVMDIDDLARQYNKATGIQRPQIEDAYKYKALTLKGVVKNVETWSTFDERTDTPGEYYRIVTEPKAITESVSYQVWVFYKDESEASMFNKGQDISTEGTLIKVVTEPGIFYIWVYAGELTEEDKIMLE